MYANNTDLLNLAPDPITTDEEVIELVQEYQTDWGVIDQASGGFFTPEKCGAYLILYKLVRGMVKLKNVREMPLPIRRGEPKRQLYISFPFSCPTTQQVKGTYSTA